MKDMNGIRISAINRAGQQAGIYEGMRLADARALLPSLITQPATPEIDARALATLADWCQCYTPIVSIDGTDGIWLDVTGATHFFGGEAGFFKDLTKRLARFGFQNRLGIAETPGAAWAIARFSSRDTPESRTIPPGQTRRFLAPLPIEALRLDEHCIHLLKRFGLKTIGNLRALPRTSLKRRFPSQEIEHAVLHRLDQALGHAPEPIVPLKPVPACYERKVCPEPILQTDSLRFVLDDLLARLCARMESNCAGARALTFSAYRTDGGVSHVAIATARPSRNAAHLAHLFRDKLETINPGFGIDLFLLSANRLEPLDISQPALSHLLHAKQTGEAIEPLIDRLANRLGPQNVHRIHTRESHIPERAEIRLSALRNTSVKPLGQSSVESSKALPKPLRPFRLLAHPEPIRVMAEVPDGPPMRFTWRRVSHRIIRSEGPERIAPEWWQNMRKLPEPTRDYYRLEDSEGRRFWVFRKGLYGENHTDGAPTWYMHGLFS